MLLDFIDSKHQVHIMNIVVIVCFGKSCNEIKLMIQKSLTASKLLMMIANHLMWAPKISFGKKKKKEKDLCLIGLGIIISNSTQHWP